MINLSTPSEELLKELLSDYAKADYWLTKKLGGMNKQKELGDKLALECIKEDKPFAVSEYIEYISPKGNRWIMYLSSRRYGDKFYTTPLGFCYYETYGSVGAFVPMSDEGSPRANSCIIFTSHFFLRMCDRLGIKVRSREMVKRFLEYLVGMMVSYRGEGKHGKHEVDVRLPGSIGRGRIREDSPYVTEINTFLRDCELTKSQLEETKLLREASSKVNLQPFNLRMERALMGEGEAVFNEMVNNLEVMGVNKQEPYMLTHIINAAYDMTIRLGYEFNIPVVQRILMDDCKGEQKFIKAAKSIFDPWRTEEEQNRILWEAIYWVALQNNPNLDNVKFWEESWRYTEELAKKRTKKK
jgi:hypothetical protein